MNSGDRSARRGLILFEVMLATAIFALVGLALSDGLGGLAETMRRGDRENQVRLGLESRLSEARVLPVETGLRREKADGAGIAYEREWKAVHLTNKDGAELGGLYLLVVRARWTDRGREDVEEASLRLYRPQL